MLAYIHTNKEEIISVSEEKLKSAYEISEDKKEEYKEIESLIDNFFEQIRGSKILEYREGQHTMALDVIDAIKNKEISH